MIRAAIAIAIMLMPGVAWGQGSNGLFDGVGSGGGTTTYIRPDGSGGYIATQPSYPSASPSIINRDGYQTDPYDRNIRALNSILGGQCGGDPAACD
jgi:hypothetical protein